MAADACSASSGRLFITDRVRKLRFLIYTGTDVCVVLQRLAPGRKERISYDLFAANGTLIPTYGWHPLTLNLALRRDFTWRFVVAEVQLSIGTDFLANFSLLVDCRNNRLLDGVTSLWTSAQTASTRFPNIKTIGIGTPADKLLAEFPDLTRPSGGAPHENDTWTTSVPSTPSPRTEPTRDSQSRVRRYAERRHGAALGWSLVVSTAPRSQEKQGLAPFYRALNARTVPDR